MNDGDFLREFIENKPVRVTSVVSLTGIKRPTIYTHFKKDRLDTSIKKKYSDGIGIIWPDDGKHILDGRQTHAQLSQKSNIAHGLNINQGASEIQGFTLNSPGDVNPNANFKIGGDGNNDNIKRVSMPNDNLNMIVVPLKAYGGFLSGYESKVYDNTLQRVSFPLVRGECFSFEIEGYSMAPEFNPGDWFVGSRLEGFDWLVKSRPYVFVTVGGIILKMFNGIVDDHASLSSLNNDYNPVAPMHIREIKGIFHKEAVIKI